MSKALKKQIEADAGKGEAPAPAMPEHVTDARLMSHDDEVQRQLTRMRHEQDARMRELHMKATPPARLVETAEDRAYRETLANQAAPHADECFAECLFCGEQSTVYPSPDAIPAIKTGSGPMTRFTQKCLGVGCAGALRQHRWLAVYGRPIQRPHGPSSEYLALKQGNAGGFPVVLKCRACGTEKEERLDVRMLQGSTTARQCERCSDGSFQVFERVA